MRLAAVIRLCDSASNRDVVTGVVDRALRRWIDGLDVDRTLAAMTLRARIAAVPSIRWRWRTNKATSEQDEVG
ncbi:MAG: hypothetical protein QOD70_3133 [Frankiales bacterium]|nr:hypothetical protein [Frankiales bacterium]